MVDPAAVDTGHARPLEQHTGKVDCILSIFFNPVKKHNTNVADNTTGFLKRKCDCRHIREEEESSELILVN